MLRCFSRYISISFFFICSAAHRDLHSFPTRRSSDLEKYFGGAQALVDAGCDAITLADNSLAILRVSNLAVGASERSEEHTSELQSRVDLVCRLLLEKKKTATP